MSNDIKNWAKKQTVGERNAKVVLLEIADVANDDGYSWYAIPTIAATLEASPKTVERGIAYLVEKGFITRTEREKKSGKFTSKGTQINISEDDWLEISELREARKAKTQFQPTDKMPDGDTQPTDNLTDGEEKPADNLTDGSENQQTICPKPTDNLSNGQNDGQYTKTKDVISEPLKETEEDEREGAGEPFEVFVEDAESLVDNPESRALEVALLWIQNHKKLSKKNFPASEWTDLIAALVPEGINSTGKFKEFYLWVENLDWVETVSPKLMRSQIEKYKKREEIEVKKGNATNQPNKSNGNGQQPKPANAGERNDRRIGNTNAFINKLREMGDSKSGVSG